MVNYYLRDRTQADIVNHVYCVCFAVTSGRETRDVIVGRHASRDAAHLDLGARRMRVSCPQCCLELAA